MGRPVFALVLALIGLLGLALRLAPTGARHVDGPTPDLGGATWIVDDPGTAFHLRRVELALAEGRVPANDPFQALGERAQIPALPLYDALIAGAADRFLRSEDGDPALGGVDERDLEAFAARLGPLAYVAAFLLAAWVASIAARGARLPVLVAAGLLALAPATIDATQVLRLDAAALAVVQLLVLARSTLVALDAEDALTTIFEALIAGVVAGLLAATSAAGAFLALPTAAALLQRAARGPLAVRPIVLRAGLLFALVAAFVSRFPLADGPWESVERGLVGLYVVAASDLLLLAAAPFALLLLFAPRDASRPTRGLLRVAALAGVLILLAWEAPRALEALRGPVAAWWESRAFVEAWAWSEPTIGRVAGVLATALCGVRFARERDPAALHLGSLAALALVLACVEPSAEPLTIAAAGLALAGSLAATGDGRASVASLVAAGLILLAANAMRASLSPGASERDDRRDAIATLRWIRANVPPGGPFNSSSAVGGWGILCDPAAGALVAYHARRPVLAAQPAAISRASAYREARRIARGVDGAEAARRMRAHGLQLAWMSSHFGSEGLLGSVGVRSTLAGEEPIPGAERIVPAVLPESDSLAWQGAPVALWRLDLDTGPARRPTITPPR